VKLLLGPQPIESGPFTFSFPRTKSLNEAFDLTAAASDRRSHSRTSRTASAAAVAATPARESASRVPKLVRVIVPDVLMDVQR
jgi:hypothetical protein